MPGGSAHRAGGPPSPWLCLSATWGSFSRVFWLPCRAQPPGFPRVRDPGHALPDGSHHAGHERAPRAAAGHLAAALRPADPGAHGHLHGHRPGRHRALLRVPPLHARARAQRQATRPLGFGSRWPPCCSAGQSLNSRWMG